MATPASLHGVRLSPGHEEAQWAQLGAFRSGKAASPVVEMVTVPASVLETLEARCGELESENEELQRANDSQLALIAQLRSQLAEVQARLSPAFKG